MLTAWIKDQPGFPEATQRAILARFAVGRLYIEGARGQTIDVALRSLRGDELLLVAGGLRPFGNSRKEIVEAFAEVKARGKVVLDPETGERSDRDGAEMLSRAIGRLHGERTIAGRAAEIGALGGKARVENVRADRLADGKAKRIWKNRRKFATNEDALKDMPGWTAASAYAEFGGSGRQPGRPPKGENVSRTS